MLSSDVGYVVSKPLCQLLLMNSPSMRTSPKETVYVRLFTALNAPNTGSKLIREGHFIPQTSTCLRQEQTRANNIQCRSQWPRGLRRRSAAARLLRVWIRIPPGAWMFVCSKCCVSSGRGLCDGPITRPEESYRMWCVVVCDLETSRVRSWPALDRSAIGKQNTSSLATFLTLDRSIYACDLQITWRVPNGLLHENTTK